MQNITTNDQDVQAGKEITFSFGKNWSSFVEVITENDISRAMDDINYWLGSNGVEGKTVIDVGCGSGIHALAFCRLGAKSVHAFDYDSASVDATRKMHLRYGSPEHWTTEQGSVLDSNYVGSLGTFDIVYSWGVLHHTGAMWDAIANCVKLMAPGGVFWLSLYAKGPRYPKDLALKKKFNASSPLVKRWMLGKRILRRMLSEAKHGRNPLAWNRPRARGMNEYHDMVDWLGGLPYETASEDELVKFARKNGLILERIKVQSEGGCSKYVLSRL